MKIFVRERITIGESVRQPRYTVLAVAGGDLKVHAHHLGPDAAALGPCPAGALARPPRAEYRLEPMAGCLFNVLLQMGLSPSFEPEFAGALHRYGSFQETVDEFAHRANRRDGTHDAAIESTVRRLFRRDAKGAWVLEHPSWQAHIWWSAADRAVAKEVRPVP